MEASTEKDHIALRFLANEGFLPLDLSDHEGMVDTFSDLFLSTSAFFSLPEDNAQKVECLAKDGPAASEEGYSRIPEEKSILTIKTSNRCPEILRAEASQAWDLTGTFMESILEAIASILGLDSSVFSPFVKPCKSLPQAERTPTLLRMFRYDRPEGPDEKVNAERHKDLGLLSLVVGHSPGLQARSPTTDRWVAVEEDNCLPPGLRSRSKGLTATLLVGETLSFLTRDKYKAGVHGVVTAPKANDPYRYSIVFALRPAVAPMFTKDFESPRVGQFPPNQQANGESSTELFKRIRTSHWNVNIKPEIRERQKDKQRRKQLALDGQG